MIKTPSRLTAALLLAACAAACSAAPAAGYEKAIWGPVTVNGVSQFPIYKDLGVDVYQAGVSWAGIAPQRPARPTDPNDPAYSWNPNLDLAVAEAKRTGIRVALEVLRTPPWANGGKAENVPPTRPADYADFIEAIARRYPGVRTFLVWGEPIRNVNFAVTSTKSPNYYTARGDARRQRLPIFTRQQRAEAGSYARLVDATYGRLKARNRAYRIVGGNTTTSGDVDPFNWIRWMRLPNGKPPRMDAFGHNPFGTRGPNLKKKQIVAGTADFSDFDVFIPWIDRYMGRSGRNRRLPIFVSEYTAPTDSVGFEFAFFVTRPLQARWLTAAFAIARRSTRIRTVGWIGLRDVVLEDGQRSNTGLIDANGVRKPAYAAYKRG